MSEQSQIIPPIKADTSAQISTARTAAIVMAAIALVGFVVWLATVKETRWESAASTTSASNLQRPVFREDASGIYVSPPPNADPAEGKIAARQTAEPVERNDAPTIVASLPVPERKPPQAPAISESKTDEPTPAQPVHDSTEVAAPVEPTPSSALDQPYEPTPAARVRREPRPDEPMSAAPVRDEPTMDEPSRDEQMTDEEATDDSSQAEPMPDESPWDEPTPEGDEPTRDESFQTEE